MKKLRDAFYTTRVVWVLGPVLVGIAYLRLLPY